MHKILFRSFPILILLSLNHEPVQAADWLMFGHDPQRSGWAMEEKSLSMENVGKLQLKWKTAVKKGKSVDAKLTSAAAYEGDVLAKVTELLRTQPENVTKTVTRFINELNAAIKQ